MVTEQVRPVDRTNLPYRPDPVVLSRVSVGADDCDHGSQQDLEWHQESECLTEIVDKLERAAFRPGVQPDPDLRTDDGGRRDGDSHRPAPARAHGTSSSPDGKPHEPPYDDGHDQKSRADGELTGEEDHESGSPDSDEDGEPKPSDGRWFVLDGARGGGVSLAGWPFELPAGLGGACRPLLARVAWLSHRQIVGESEP